MKDLRAAWLLFWLVLMVFLTSNTAVVKMSTAVTGQGVFTNSPYHQEIASDEVKKYWGIDKPPAFEVTKSRQRYKRQYPESRPGAPSGLSINFESYQLGIIDRQQGWSDFGAAGLGCALYDRHVVLTSNYSNLLKTFGNQSYQASNFKASGCFSDQAFSPSLPNEAGESTAQNGGLSGGVRQTGFTASLQFIPAVNRYQPNLVVGESPDRGDGARDGLFSIRDLPDDQGGLTIYYFDFRHLTNITSGPVLDDFVQTTLATNLRRDMVHTILFSITFLEGPANDVVKISIDGKPITIPFTTWEDFFREFQGGFPVTVDSLLLRTGGSDNPLVQPGEGFLFDNLAYNSGPGDTDGDGIPDDVDQCPSGDNRLHVFINNRDTGVINRQVGDALGTGCTLADIITKQNCKTKDCYTNLFIGLFQRGVITKQELVLLNQSVSSMS